MSCHSYTRASLLGGGSLLLAISGCTIDSTAFPVSKEGAVGEKADVATRVSEDSVGVERIAERAPALTLRRRGERNVLLVVLDDVGSTEWGRSASELSAAIVAPQSSGEIRDTDADGVPDGLEDEDGDGALDGVTPTPTLDQLADSGVLFSQTWSAPLCSPTRATLYTGRHPAGNGIGFVVDSPLMVDALPADVPTLAETLAGVASPYATALFGKWHLGSEGTLPTDRGWGHFAGRVEDGGNNKDQSHYVWEKSEADAGGSVTVTEMDEYDLIVQVTDALAWIEAQSGPWWATLALNAAHSPYDTPPESCTGSPDGQYTDLEIYHLMIQCADTEIGRLIDGLPDEVLAQTTIVVLGDNGTDADVSTVFPRGRAKGSIYAGGVQVPLLVADGAALLGREPRRQRGAVSEPGRVVAAPVEVVDVGVLIAEVTGVEMPDTDGIGLDAYLAAVDVEDQRTVGFTEFFVYDAADIATLTADGGVPSISSLASLTKDEHDAALVHDGLSLVWANGSYQLFDMSVDPFQQDDVWCRDEDYAARGLALVELIRERGTDFPEATCDGVAAE